MAITIQNQLKTEWYQPNMTLPIWPIDDDQFLNNATTHLKNELANICFAPSNASQPVIVYDDQTKQTIDLDTLTAAFQASMHQQNIDEQLSNQLKEILQQSLKYHTKNTWYTEEQLIVEALNKLKLPLPGYTTKQRVVYSINADILPSGKKLYTALKQGTTDCAHEKMEYFASLGGYIKSSNFDTDYLYVTFKDDHAYQLFKNQLKISTLPNNATDAKKLYHELQQNIHFKKDFQQALFLPKQNQVNTYSMMRYLQYQLAIFGQTNPNEMFVQPINLKQVYTPMNIVFINLEKLIGATQNEIEKAFVQLTELKQKSIYLIENKNLLKLESIQNLENQKSKQRNNTNGNKKYLLKLSKSLPQKPANSEQLLKMLLRIFEKQTTNNVSKNIYRTMHTTYMKPNRREPDNINKAGIINDVRYRPDIHMFIDTSGSVSEAHYKATVLMLIHIAKKMNVDIYVNFFSTVLTKTYLLNIKGLTVKQAYQQFNQLPKVTGGTNYQNVWNFINNLDKKLKTPRLYFMVTDFEYYVYKSAKFNETTPAYKKLYYIPLALTGKTKEVREKEWNYTKKTAQSFMKQMIAVGADKIRSHILI